MDKKEILQFVAQEIEKCKKNPIYFLETYAKVLTEKDGPQPFEMYDFQKEKCIKPFLAKKRIVIIKGRQMGVSTIVAGYILWNIIFKKYFKAVIISKDREAAQGVIATIQLMIDQMPSWIMPEQKEKNKQSIGFANHSIVSAFASSTESGRSFAVKLLIFDEAAFIESADSIFRAAMPSLSKTNGQFIMLSTPSGVGNLFAQKYLGAPENGFHAEKIMWYEMPERTEEWGRERLLEMGPRDWAQEFNCDLQQSGNTVISPNDITAMEKEIKKPEFKISVRDDFGHKLNKDNELWVWQKPEEGAQYIISADVARGDGMDYSAFHIFKIPSEIDILNGQCVEQVAEFKAQVPTDAFGKILNIVGREYNEAIVIVENNSVGIATLNELIREEYPTLYYTDKATKQVSIFQNVNTEQVNSVPGFSTTTANRQILIPNALEKLWRNKGIKFYSKRLINEAWTWVWLNGKAMHDNGCNDDLMMAAAIFSHVYDTSIKEMGISSEKFKAAMDVLITKEQNKKDLVLDISKNKRGLEGRNPWKFRYKDSTINSPDEEVWDLSDLCN